MGKLTAAAVRAARRPGLHGDGGTLYLAVAPGGSKSWIQRVTVAGRRRDIGLGGYPVVSLAKARQRAMANRVAIADGIDPLVEKRRSNTPTFRTAAVATFEANRPRWRSERTARAWMQSLEKHAFPEIGGLRVNCIAQDDVLRILKPLWHTRPQLARKLRQRIRATLQWCQAHGHLTNNVAGEAIDGALPAMPAVKAHYRALPWAEVGSALNAIRNAKVSESSRLCFEFLVLTAARSGEALAAAWAEIDLEAREWRIPAERMKTGVVHAVPLGDAALGTLESARGLGGERFVFPSPVRRCRPLGESSLLHILRKTGLAGRTTVHGFRSAFRSWAGECTDADHAVMELCLAHTVGSAVERAYARSDLMDKRRTLLAAWAEAICAS
ncbi:MAG: integrase arm-type DNA-binding domain-containing protein [Gammaproteobacteria bacterium]|nr:integrase arm-type DNA-binding domain-containing protein [Gammaproteobacteria bacterium]